MAQKFVKIPGDLNDVREVVIRGNQADPEIQAGRKKPPLIATEELQSVNIVLSGKDLINPSSGNGFDFQVDIHSNLFSARAVQLKKVIVAKPPLIHESNRYFGFCVRDILGHIYYDLEIALAVGYYSPDELASEMTAKIYAAMFDAGVTYNSVVDISKYDVNVSYDQLTRRFTTASVHYQFAYVNWTNSVSFSESTFLTRGINLFNVYYRTATLGSITLNLNDHSVVSGHSLMAYSRYYVIKSHSLNQYSFFDSQSSDGKLSGDVLGYVDIVGRLTAEDFTPTSTPNHFISVDFGDSAPKVNLANSQRNLSNMIDIFCLDEFGVSVNEIYNIDVDVPSRQAERGDYLTVFLQVYF